MRRGRAGAGPAAWESRSPPSTRDPLDRLPGYVATPFLRMTHQGHSLTTLWYGFTRLRDNDSANSPRTLRRSSNRWTSHPPHQAGRAVRNLLITEYVTMRARAMPDWRPSGTTYTLENHYSQ